MSGTPNGGPRRGSMAGGTEDDFRGTAETMLIDAHMLDALKRYRNACYLAGYVVECTLKVLIEAASLRPVERTHSLTSLREQILQLSISAGQAVAKYGDPMQFAHTMITGGAARSKQTGGGRCDWDPLHRYNGSRWADEAKSTAYLQEADKAVAILNQLFLDGGLR